MTEQKSEHEQAMDAAMAAFWRYELPAVSIRNPHRRAEILERGRVEAAVKAYNEHRRKVFP